MADSKVFTCDICGRKRDKRFTGEVLVGNGERKNYPEVCDSCVKAIDEKVEELKRKN